MKRQITSGNCKLMTDWGGGLMFLSIDSKITNTFAKKIFTCHIIIARPISYSCHACLLLSLCVGVMAAGLLLTSITLATQEWLNLVD